MIERGGGLAVEQGGGAGGAGGKALVLRLQIGVKRRFADAGGAQRLAERAAVDCGGGVGQHGGAGAVEIGQRLLLGLRQRG
ncbi:MAG TPA: hypothetical protein PL031_08400 [Neisseria sp.]|nr:hypothetical protein [Neisseria sp.]